MELSLNWWVFCPHAKGPPTAAYAIVFGQNYDLVLILVSEGEDLKF